MGCQSLVSGRLDILLHDTCTTGKVLGAINERIEQRDRATVSLTISLNYLFF